MSVELNVHSVKLIRLSRITEYAAIPNRPAFVSRTVTILDARGEHQTICLYADTREQLRFVFPEEPCPNQSSRLPSGSANPDDSLARASTDASTASAPCRGT